MQREKEMKKLNVFDDQAEEGGDDKLNFDESDDCEMNEEKD